jgi:hypothetical protein
MTSEVMHAACFSIAPSPFIGTRLVLLAYKSLKGSDKLKASKISKVPEVQNSNIVLAAVWF